MNSVEIPLFYDELRLNALKKHYEGTIEGYLEYYLDILYEEIVPQDEQNQIRQTNENIRAQEEAEAKANDRYSLNHIRENNKDYYFIDRQAKDLMSASRLYRQYTNSQLTHRLNKFRDIYNKATIISRGMYFSLLKGYCDNANITSVLEFDLDNGFANSKENNQMQWVSYPLKDLSTAIYFADLKKYAKTDERLNEFQSRIAKSKNSDSIHFHSASLLTEDWKWKSYDDGSGGLERDDGKSYFDYDYSTQEYEDTRGNWQFMSCYPAITSWEQFRATAEMIAVKEGLAEFNESYQGIIELESKLDIPECDRKIVNEFLKDFSCYYNIEDLNEALKGLYEQRECDNSFDLNTVGRLAEFYPVNAICHMMTDANKEIFVDGIEFERDCGNDIPNGMYEVYKEIINEQAQTNESTIDMLI